MFPTTLSADFARQHQADLRADAGRRSLARLLRRPPEPAPPTAPTYGGITAVPSLPKPRTAPDEHIRHRAA